MKSWRSPPAAPVYVKTPRQHYRKTDRGGATHVFIYVCEGAGGSRPPHKDPSVQIKKDTDVTKFRFDFFIKLKPASLIEKIKTRRFFFTCFNHS